MSDFEDISEKDFEDVETAVSGSSKLNLLRPDSAFDMMAGLINSIPWKLSIFVFLLFMFVSSDLFIDWILTRFSNSVDHRTPTPKGVLIQGLFLVLCMIMIQLLVDINIL